MPRLRTFLLVAAAAVVASAIVVVKTADNKTCGSADVRNGKPVGIIGFRPGAQEITVGGNLSMAPITNEGVDHWRIRSTQGEGVEIKVFPLTSGGQTLFQNIGPEQIVLRDAPNESCADSINPKARRGYTGIGTVEVYLAPGT